MKKVGIFFITILLLGGGLFTSCENFFSGSELRAEIEKHVAYANSPLYTIRMDCPENSGIIKSPAGGEVSKKVSDVFTVRFEPASDREFIRWKVMDSVTGDEVTDDGYLTLSSLTESETECTFKKAPGEDMRLCLEPVIVERPQILSYTPLFEANGVNKDSAILVIFDYDLNEDSIYFTDDEVKKWENTYGVTLLPPVNVNGRTRYYGYKKDGKTFFKNISITDNETGENLNDYFSAPMFENPHRLSIYVKKNDSGNAILPPWIQVLVSLERGFFYKVDDKPVCMTAGKKWIYQVTDSVDTTSPGVTSNVVKVMTSSTETKTLTALSEVPSSPWASSSIPYDNCRKLLINCKIKDTGGSGPADSFLVNFQKVGSYDQDTVDTTTNSIVHPTGWTTETAKEYPSKSMSYQSVMGENAECNKTLDFSDMNLEDGVYAVTFKFTDKSGNSTVYPSNGNKFYFNIDTQAPHFYTIYDRETRKYYIRNFNSPDSITIDWTPDSSNGGYTSRDLKQIMIKYKKSTESSYSNSVNVGANITQKEFGELQSGTTYDFMLYFEDYNGNTAEFYQPCSTKNRPNPPRNIREKKFDTSGTTPKITVEWDEPIGNYDYCKIYFSWWIKRSNGTGTFKSSELVTLPKGTTSYTQEITGNFVPNSGAGITVTMYASIDGSLDDSEQVGANFDH